MLSEYLQRQNKAEQIERFMDLAPNKGVYTCRLKGFGLLGEIDAFTALFPRGPMTEFAPLIKSDDYPRSLIEHIAVIRGLSVNPDALKEAALLGIKTDLQAAAIKESECAVNLLPCIVLAFGRSKTGKEEVVVLLSINEFAPDSALRQINSGLDVYIAEKLN